MPKAVEPESPSLAAGGCVVLDQLYSLNPAQAGERLKLFQSAYTEQILTIDQQQWRYWRTGCGRRPLLMIPGVQGGGAVFFDVVLQLARELDMLIVTAPPIVDPLALVDAHQTYLIALGIEEIDLFGSSLGGYLAQLFCLRHPGRVERLILANTFVDPSPFLERAPRLDWVARQSADQIMAANLSSFLDGLALDPGQAALRTVMHALVGPVQTAEDYKARLMTLLESRAIDRVAIPDDRIVLIDDDNDPAILPEMRALIRQRYGRSKRYMIAGGGHLPAIQRPQSVVRVLRSVLGTGESANRTSEDAARDPRVGLEVVNQKEARDDFTS
jgi:maspardin